MRVNARKLCDNYNKCLCAGTADEVSKEAVLINNRNFAAKNDNVLLLQQIYLIGFRNSGPAIWLFTFKRKRKAVAAILFTYREQHCFLKKVSSKKFFSKLLLKTQVVTFCSFYLHSHL